MAINVSQAFHRTSANPIDESMALTKAEMLTVNDNIMPAYYFTICQDDGAIYLYDKTAEVSDQTGKFKKLEVGEEYVENADLGNLIVALYDSEKADYAVGDYVIYNKRLYKCKTENTRESPTDTTDWESTTLIGLINNRFNELGTVLSYEGNKTVAQLNALTTRSKKPGRVYSVTDTGTLTEGTFDNNGFDGNLRPGDEVALNSSKLWTYLGNVTETDQFVTEDELSDVTAPKWNESDTYTLGKSVLHERKVYVCKVDSATVGTWVSSEWRRIKVGESFGQNTDGNYTYPGLVPMVSGTDKVLTEEGWTTATIASKEDVEYIIDEEKYNPLNLPHNTVRVRTSDGLPPERDGHNTSYDVATKVAGSDDLYDVYKESNEFTSLLFGSQNVVEVLGANTRTIIRADNMFEYCTNLERVALFDTSKISNMNSMFSLCYKLEEVPLFNTSISESMNSMFYRCTKLKHIPLFDASRCNSVYNMFSDCVNVESGALDLYNQLKDYNRLASEDKHGYAFENCGINTVTGAAELAQIPDDWKGVTSV